MFGGKKKKILENGLQARAVAIDVRDTGTTINNNPRIKVMLQVTPDGQPSFQATKTVTVSRLSIPSIGSEFWVRYDPSDTSRVEFDEAKVAQDNDAARAAVAGAAASAIPDDLAASGILGRGSVIDVQKMPAGPLVTCTLTMGIRLVDGTPPYRATSQLTVAPDVADRVLPSQTICSVRADPQNHQRVAVSLTEETPIVEVTDANVVDTPARALREGTPCHLTITARGRQFLKLPTGEELWATAVRISDDGSETQMIQPVPLSAMALYEAEGKELPAKRILAEPGVLTIDWAAAATGAATGSAPTAIV